MGDAGIIVAWHMVPLVGQWALIPRLTRKPSGTGPAAVSLSVLSMVPAALLVLSWLAPSATLSPQSPSEGSILAAWDTPWRSLAAMAVGAAFLPHIAALEAIEPSPVPTFLRKWALQTAPIVGIQLSLLATPAIAQAAPLWARGAHLFLLPVFLYVAAYPYRQQAAPAPVPGPTPRAEVATAMARVLVGSTQRLGAELAVAASQARQLAAEASPAVADSMATLLQALHRGQVLVGTVGQFAEPAPQSRSMVDILGPLRRAMTRTRRDSACTFALHVTVDTTFAWVDTFAVERAFYALLRNAAEAQATTDPPPTIWVSVGEATPSDATPAPLAGTFAPFPHLLVCIRDQGTGISDQVRERCIEPFYTTRANHDGLGLLAAIALVQGEDAAFDLRAHPEGGAEARLWLRATGTETPNDSDWTWSLAGQESQTIDILIVCSDPAQVEQYGIFFHARARRWTAIPSIAALPKTTVAPRPGGVLVLVDAPDAEQLPMLTRWLAPRSLHVVAPPSTVASLLGKGLPINQVSAHNTKRPQAVVREVEHRLTASLLSSGSGTPAAAKTPAGG